MPKSIYREEYGVLLQLVREMRVKAGLPQTSVAKELGVGQSFLSDVERGARRLNLIELRDLAHACGTTLPRIVEELEARLSAWVGSA